jgi:hypothetical protein
MTEMWIRDLRGDKAVIDPADSDRWKLHGWSQTDEPGGNEQVFVWMINPETDRAAPIAWAAREYWMGRGFVPSPPDEPVNPTKDPVLTVAPAKPPAASAPVKSTSAAKSAAKNQE